MADSLGPLYHWSPRDRLPSIKRLGLVPGRRNVAGPTYHNGKNDEDGEFVQPMLCFSGSPAVAWSYSHGVWKFPGTYDLWQVYLTSEDEVHVLPGWGDRVTEIRVANRIKKSRLIWVGERTIEGDT